MGMTNQNSNLEYMGQYVYNYSLLDFNAVSYGTYHITQHHIIRNLKHVHRVQLVCAGTP
jgi:hypothetical protein